MSEIKLNIGRSARYLRLKSHHSRFHLCKQRMQIVRLKCRTGSECAPSEHLSEGANSEVLRRRQTAACRAPLQVSAEILAQSIIGRTVGGTTDVEGDVGSSAFGFDGSLAMRCAAATASAPTGADSECMHSLIICGASIDISCISYTLS